MNNFKIDGSHFYQDGRRVGWITIVNGKHVFIAPRKKEHYFWLYEGWGLSEEILCFLRKIDYDQVHLKVRLKIGKYKLLISELPAWFEHGIPYQKLPYEKQLVLPEKFFVNYQKSLDESLS